MHGLVNRAIQSFLRETYGASVWTQVTAQCSLSPHGFEAMLIYDDPLTDRVLDSAALTLGQSRYLLLEDIGTWLIASQTGQPLRRLLRFSGKSFPDFLHSLEDLPDRARLALPELDIPQLTLRELEPGNYELTCYGRGDFSFILLGVLRAMADDYGTLAMIEPKAQATPNQVIHIQIHEAQFATARDFQLAPGD